MTVGKFAERLTEVNNQASGHFSYSLGVGRERCALQVWVPLKGTLTWPLGSCYPRKGNFPQERGLYASVGPGEFCTSNWKMSSLKKSFKGLKPWLWDSLEEIEWGDHGLPSFLLSPLIKASFVAAVKENNSISMFCKSSIKRRGKRKKDAP